MTTFDVIGQRPGFNQYVLLATNVPQDKLGDFLERTMVRRGPQSNPNQNGLNYAVTVHLHPTFWSAKSLQPYDTERF